MSVESAPEWDPTARLMLDLTSSAPVGWRGPLGPEQLELAHHHGLIGMLATHHSSVLSRPAVAPYARLAGRQEIMVSHLRRLLSLLDEASVRATVLKGPYLARMVYRDPRQRTYTDVDVLVPDSQLDLALEVLAKDPAVARLPPKRPKADKRDVAIKDESGTWFMLDLHWDLFSYTQLLGCALGATAEAWKRSIGPIETEFGVIHDLPLEARLAFLSTHALLDHRFRLILFRDLAELARLAPEWDEVGRFSTRWGLRSFVYLSLLIANQVADASVSEDVLNALRPPSSTMRVIESLLPRADLVRFDGHRPHPLNLALVTLHDRRSGRLRLIWHAPAAAPQWLRRFGRFPLWRDRRWRNRGGSAPRVLILVSSDQRRGAEVFASQLSEGLRERGWSTELAALSQTDDPARVHAVPLSSVPPSQLGRLDLEVVSALRRKIGDWGPDVVVANGGATLRYAVAAVAGRLHRPKLVYSSIGEPKYWIRSRRHALIQKLLHQRADMILAVSEATRSQLIEQLGLPGDGVKVVPTGVPEAYFELARAQGDGHLRLLFMGNLSPEKNPIGALEILAEVRGQFDARLRFVGTGPLESTLRRLAAERFTEGDVEFTGSVDDVSPHLSWADLLLLPSISEGLPGAVLEAGAAGVPSVSSDVGGAGEAMVDGLTGVLTRPEEMAAHVISLGWDTSRREGMGEAARVFVRDHFTMAAALGRYEAILTDLIPSARALPLPKSPTPVRS